MLRADDQALEQLAVGHFRGAEISANETSMAIEELEVLPVAIRTRLIKLLFDQLVTGTRENSPLTHQHVMTVEALISRWSGQGEIALPLGVSAKREYGRLTLKRGN